MIVVAHARAQLADATGQHGEPALRSVERRPDPRLALHRGEAAICTPHLVFQHVDLAVEPAAPQHFLALHGLMVAGIDLA